MLTLTSSTVSGNFGREGGGIWNRVDATLTLTDSTVSGNTASIDGGGINNSFSGTGELANSIIAGNGAPTGPDCTGSPTSVGHNLIGTNDGCNFTRATGDLVNVDPKLGPLADNGGPTFTHALLPGSPAIDAGDRASCRGTDQRGVARPVDGDGDGDGIPVCDIGAFEASILWVNSNDDVDDTVCDATHCSLREAINASNAIPNTDTIAFHIPGAGPHTIQPTSALPTITDPVIIDGYTQPGASPNTNPVGQGLNTVLKIEPDGTNAGGSGLVINAGHTTVKGLVINRFHGIGIVLDGIGGNVIEGNFIGTDVTGTFDLGNFGSGVFISAASDNMIGGTAAGAGNVISGNNVAGVSIVNGSMGNTVQGNFIGTDVTGTLAVGNRFDGVEIENAPGNLIGGTTAGAGNLLSGNHSGIYIGGFGATGNLVLGNLIGTDAKGIGALGNIGDGIEVRNANGNTIGGTGSSGSNTIAYNGVAGVVVFSGMDNVILSNSIFSNAGLGIDLVPYGVTLNDGGDGDAGANDLQNFPVVTSATSGGGSVTIEGTLDTAPNTTFRLEFFSNSSCDPTGHGEGQTFVGSTNVTSDFTGNVRFAVTFPDTGLVGRFITATATDQTKSTSEFSRCQAVVRGGDANGDGVVDMADLRLVAAALGTSDGADLNDDGLVDVRDLVLVGISFGGVAP